jgi:hypothetical protein
MLNHIIWEESKPWREKNERLSNVGSCLEFKTLSLPWEPSSLPVSHGLRMVELPLTVSREPQRNKRPLFEHIGNRGWRWVERGMLLILQKNSASHKISGSGLLSKNLVVGSSANGCYIKFCNMSVTFLTLK